MLSFRHSLSSTSLAHEADYVKKRKVQGSSFEVGAKVTYEGREMTVSMAPDSDGDIKMIDLSGVTALAACLPECRSLTSLKCAAAAHPSVCFPALRTLSLLSLHVPILASEAYVILGPFPGTFLLSPKHFLHSLANAHAPSPFPSTRCLRDAALLVCRVCTKATSSFRRASRECSRTHVTPLWPPCRSLELNELDNQAKKAIKAAAGSGVEIQF